ncbi:MAG TPA: efflux RND transporter permease subunit, partial [Chloroflexota bacterium]
LERPVAITMLFLALAFMGVVAYTRLPVQRFPNTSFPTIRVTVSYPGASPEDVETLVTKVIEDAVVGIGGIDRITSDSNQGSSNVQLSFAEGADINVALAEVSRKVSAIRRKLPTGAGDPSIVKGDPSDFPIMNISISADNLDLPTLTDLVSQQIQPTLQSVDGVADVNLVGGANRQIQVRVDPVKLAAYGVSLSQVQTAIASQNVGLPGGQVRTTTEVLNTRTQALAQQPAELANIVINTPTGGGNAATAVQPVHLKEVADVLDTTTFQRSFQRLNGNTSVGLIITKQSGANEIKVAEAVRQAIRKIETSMGRSGLHFEIVNDTSRFTTAALDDVQRDLYLAMLITGLVLLLFLHTLRNTGMVLVAIPTSLLTTFLIMFFLGFSLDIMSLMALALLIGILVDDSIVVLENINRHLGLGKSPWQAAIDGRSEIGLAAIAITATDVVVYTPVAFMAGNIGQLFREFGLAIVAATVLSLLVSFTLTPMLASRLLKEEALEHIKGRGPWAVITRAWEAGFARLRQAYWRLIGAALNVRWLPVLLGAGSVGLAIAFIPLHVLGTEFVPAEDDN